MADLEVAGCYAGDSKSHFIPSIPTIEASNQRHGIRCRAATLTLYSTSVNTSPGNVDLSGETFGAPVGGGSHLDPALLAT